MMEIRPIARAGLIRMKEHHRKESLAHTHPLKVEINRLAQEEDLEDQGLKHSQNQEEEADHKKLVQDTMLALHRSNLVNHLR